MTTYPASIDKTETSAYGETFPAIAGLGGVTAGYAVKWDGTTAKTVVAVTATSDVIVGVAATDAAAGAPVQILANGCKVVVPATITLGGKVGITTAGLPCTYSSGDILGICETSATLASIIRVQMQY